MNDVWNFIGQLKEESLNFESSSNHSVLKDIYHQLPFFVCTNVFIDSKAQKDITKFLYCKETNTYPYSNKFDEIPSIWIEKHFLIKQALSILQQEQREELRKDNGSRDK